MKKIEINQDFAKRFKKSYRYKMGGTQTVIFPTGESFFFNDKEYYSGRGAKYNGSVKHDNVGEVVVSSAEVKKAMKEIRQRDRDIKICEKARKERNKRIQEAAKAGIYSIKNYEHGKLVELSEAERNGRFFDETRLAATLKISVEDARLLHSRGKTYVFAKSQDGNVYELYHPDLDCNPLYIHIGNASPERIAEFEPEKWHTAPFAHLVGSTGNNNHFVC